MVLDREVLVCTQDGTDDFIANDLIRLEQSIDDFVPHWVRTLVINCEMYDDVDDTLAEAEGSIAQGRATITLFPCFFSGTSILSEEKRAVLMHECAHLHQQALYEFAHRVRAQLAQYVGPMISVIDSELERAAEFDTVGVAEIFRALDSGWDDDDDEPDGGPRPSLDPEELEVAPCSDGYGDDKEGDLL